MFGDGHLEAGEPKDSESGERRTINVGGVFSFIGATPRITWLSPEIETDTKGFIKTGMRVSKSMRGQDSAHRFIWKQVVLESSPQGTCARILSNGLRLRSAKERWQCSSYMSI